MRIHLRWGQKLVRQKNVLDGGPDRQAAAYNNHARHRLSRAKFIEALARAGIAVAQYTAEEALSEARRK